MSGYGVPTHGHTVGGDFTPTYITWIAMKGRCLNSKHVKYPRYGGRGIVICERWLTYSSFLADMGERPDGTTIDRIDNDGHYEPGNCRWATAIEQASKRSTNHFIEHNGVRRTLAEWARALGMKYGKLQRRVEDNWPIDLALDPNATVRGSRKQAIRAEHEAKRAAWKTVRSCHRCGASYTPIQQRSRYCSRDFGKRAANDRLRARDLPRINARRNEIYRANCAATKQAGR
jgi:hypothetical protein